MVVKLFFNMFYLLSLVPEFHKLVCLLLIVLFNKLVKISNLFVKVFVNVDQLSFGHLYNCVPLGVKYLNFFFAEIKLFACLINLFL